MANRALNIGNTINKIPYDIIEQILLRLPIEDLANFKTLWLSIITNPLFIYSKLKFDWPPLSLTSSCITSPYLLTLSRNNDCLICTIHRPSQYPNDDNTLQWCKTTLYTSDILEWQTGESEATCLHGLICFNNFRSVYICNPLTRKSVTAPEPSWFDCCTFVLSATGFGFCSSINKYKVVHVCGCQCKNHALFNPWVNHNRAEVLTLGVDDSWRTIKLEEGQCLPIGKALIIDNVMYWKTATEENFVIRLLTFDICKEEFKVIAVSVPEFLFHVPYELIEFEGKLCIVQNLQKYENPNETKFYVPKDMKKLEDCWILKLKLLIPQPRLRGRFPIGIIANNIYVMKSIRPEIEYFDFSSGRLLRSDPHNGPYETRNVVPYVPSLVPILLL